MNEPIGSALALTSEQHEFTDEQVKALEHLGVDSATPADLAVFHHVCQTTGLDPFARQIYMIQRQGKWTIQTGIDGFRLIGRRAADRAHHTVSMTDAEWFHREQGWQSVWDRQWGTPLAARVTIVRNGEKFPATALFDEYKGVKANGHVNAMWEQRPAGQLAKCAEALAWRKAFPQDLAGLYTDDEMEQANNPTTATGPEVTTATQVSVTDITGTPTEEVDGEPMVTDDQMDEIGNLLRTIGITDRRAGADYLNSCLPDGRTVRARAALTQEEAEGVLLALRDDAAKQIRDQATPPPATDQPPVAPADPATEQPADPWADVDVKQPPVTGEPGDEPDTPLA